MLSVVYRNIITDSDGKDLAKLDRRTRRQRQSAATGSLLRDLLEREAGYQPESWRLIANADGKPTIQTTNEQSALDVSMSHSGSIAAVGITDIGDLGVDVEYRSPKRSIAEIAAYAFGPREREIVATGGIAAFYRIWTLREALAKALGIGLSMVADRRDYFVGAPASGDWQSIIDGRRWHFFAGELPGDYAIAIAIASTVSIGPVLTIRKFD